MDLPLSDFRRMAVEEFDTSKLLAHASRQAAERGYRNFPIIDVDDGEVPVAAFGRLPAGVGEQLGGVEFLHRHAAEIAERKIHCSCSLLASSLLAHDLI